MASGCGLGGAAREYRCDSGSSFGYSYFSGNRLRRGRRSRQTGSRGLLSGCFAASAFCPSDVLSWMPSPALKEHAVPACGVSASVATVINCPPM